MNSLRRSLLILATATTLFRGTALADEVRLDDGRVLVGKVVIKGDVWEITTADGLVVVPQAKVVQHRTDEVLRAELAKMAKGNGETAFAHLHLARQARAYGLLTELWLHLDQTVQLQRAEPKKTGPGENEESSRAPLQRRIDDFLAQLEPELLPRKWRTADTKVRVHMLLEQVRSDTSLGKLMAIEELLVREPNADQELRTEARRNSSDRRRTRALGALLRREMAGNDHFVLRTAILDGSGEVRDAAIDLIRDHGHADAEAVQYLAPGLMHPSGKLRIRTAEALGALGQPDAAKLLVIAAPNAGKALAAADQGVRGHVAFINQQAYIRDFDVEVAQAAFIADPKIDTLQSGAVLDVTVAGVFEEVHILRSYRLALKQLLGTDPGTDPRSWPAWLAGQAERPAPATTGRR